MERPQDGSEQDLPLEIFAIQISASIIALVYKWKCNSKHLFYGI
jgi:hypothetical protein